MFFLNESCAFNPEDNFIAHAMQQILYFQPFFVIIKKVAILRTLRYIYQPAVQMSKYKTLISTYRAPLEESIQRKLMENLTNRKTISHGTQQPLMSTNKSIVYIKLPKKKELYLNNLRSSLYEASVKRLKQQKSLHQKETKIPYLNSKKKSFEEFQEQVLKKLSNSREKQQKSLPSVHYPGKSFNRYSTYKNVLSQSCELGQYQPGGSMNRRIDFMSEQRVFEQSNLKQKYLKMKQHSLSSKIQEKYPLSFGTIQQQIENSHRFKIKEVEDHMNRYNPRDLFHARLNGFKTSIYPHQQGQKSKHRYEEESQQLQSQFSNFIKRKKLKSTLFSDSRREVNQRKKQNKPKVYQKQKVPIADCTPWQTIEHID